MAIDAPPRLAPQRSTWSQRQSLLPDAWFQGVPCCDCPTTDENAPLEWWLVPDLLVCDPATLQGDWITTPPLLVVEVLSPSTRKCDLSVKASEYLKAGIRQYWTVDPKKQTLVVRENADDHWQKIAILDAEHSSATVPLITTTATENGADDQLDEFTLTYDAIFK